MRASATPLLFFFQLFLTLVATSTTSYAQSPTYDIDQISRAAVQVIVDNATGSGTLIIVDGTPMVFTNRHVVEGFDQTTIAVLSDPNAPAQPMFVADLVGFSQEYDFAVYRLVEDLQGNAISATQLRDGSFGLSIPEITVQDISDKDSDVRRGDAVGIFGYPGIGDNELVYTTGIISSVQYGEYKGQRLPMWYRTTAEMSPGNSGGMALNAKGEFIGIPTSVTTENLTGGRLGSLLAVPFVLAILEDDQGLLASWNGIDSDLAGAALDFLQEPGFGAITLAPQELSEPFFTDIMSGGSVDVTYLGDNCVGFAATNPDFRIQLSDDMADLSFLFFASDDSADTTLIVNAADGEWHCNDDRSLDSLNPSITLNKAPAGQYDVWVGSFNSNESVSGVLALTEGSEIGELIIPGNNPGSILDVTGSPHYGSAELAAGFVPDPRVVNVSAGGSVDVASAQLGDDCRGFASIAPDFQLNWSGESSNLHIYFVARVAGNDATLIINNPNGRWLCNDDSPSSLNPGITINSPPAGRYDIWVGAYSQGEFISGKLSISELSPEFP